MFNGLENSPVDRKGPITKRPLHKPDMQLCINVMASCRPNYLYICLDSIFRNTVFSSENRNKPDVYVYIAKLQEMDSFAKEILKVASCFPVSGVYIDAEHKGIGESFWDSFSTAFEMEYDFCIYIEDDFLITTDALQWFYDVPKITPHYSLYRWSDRMDILTPEEYKKHCHDGANFTVFRDAEYLSCCQIFSKDSYNFIHNIIKANAVWGLYNGLVPEGQIQKITYTDFDRLIIPVMKHHKLLSMAPPRSLLAHFGSASHHAQGFGRGIHRHEQMFEGEPRTWLDNVVEMFSTTTAEEKAELSFLPHNFNYS